MQTHDLGRIYVATMNYPVGAALPALSETSWSVETEPPYRYGRGVAVRLPFSRRAVVVGIWGRDTHTEDEALCRAVNGQSGPAHRQWWNAAHWWDDVEA